MNFLTSLKFKMIRLETVTSKGSMASRVNAVAERTGSGSVRIESEAVDLFTEKTSKNKENKMSVISKNTQKGAE